MQYEYSDKCLISVRVQFGKMSHFHVYSDNCLNGQYSSSQQSKKQTTFYFTWTVFYVQDILYCRSTVHSLFMIILVLYTSLQGCCVKIWKYSQLSTITLYVDLVQSDIQLMFTQAWIPCTRYFVLQQSRALFVYNYTLNLGNQADVSKH